MTTDFSADLLLLARYAALGCAHGGTIDDIAAVASAAIRLQSHRPSTTPTPAPEPPRGPAAPAE